MKRITNHLQGVVTVRIFGALPEALLNACAKEGLTLWSVQQREDFVLECKLFRRSLGALRQLAQRHLCSVEVESRRGLPFFLGRFRRRYGLLAGIFCCILMVGISSQFVFFIDVEGNERVSTAEILSVLRQHGVHPGVYGKGIDQRDLANDMLLSMEELSFFTLNLHGIRGEVIVREALLLPDGGEKDAPADVIATATGIVTHMEAIGGQALCEEGETVVEGQVLISGIIDLQEPAYSEEDIGFLVVQAGGKVYARTWRTEKAKIPLSCEVKVYTGAEKSRYSLNIAGRRVNFYGNGRISFPKYDKITTNQILGASERGEGLLRLEKELFRGYETETIALSWESAAALLEQVLLSRVKEQITEGEILRTDFVTRWTEGFLEVTILAECAEQIGKTVPLTRALPLPQSAVGEAEQGQE